jgi:hypothetical protein
MSKEQLIIPLCCNKDPPTISIEEEHTYYNGGRAAQRMYNLIVATRINLGK